ncbi:MAG TPA: hypothetical protein VKK61_07665, partial [Tepidisphaeraceae bacterium]|nr:hypothetical protein [Tepidisphaeraceae bacterium]
MPKTPTQPDVLILGDHPCAYLAAAILAQSQSIRVCHATIPGEKVVDRLVTINPALFDLHEIISPLKNKLELEPIYGLKFLADDPATASSHVNESIAAYVGSYKQIRAEMVKLAQKEGVKFHQPTTLEISGLDETGLDIEIDGAPLHAT